MRENTGWGTSKALYIEAKFKSETIAPLVVKQVGEGDSGNFSSVSEAGKTLSRQTKELILALYINEELAKSRSASPIVAGALYTASQLLGIPAYKETIHGHLGTGAAGANRYQSKILSILAEDLKNLGENESPENITYLIDGSDPVRLWKRKNGPLNAEIQESLEELIYSTRESSDNCTR
jgi:hypothetical protein